MNNDLRSKVKEDLQKLFENLDKRKTQTVEILDIKDVLAQIHSKIGDVKNPEALINRLVNYIRSLAIKGRIHFSSTEEQLIIDLGVIGQQAGLNGVYMADFSDKAQFYSVLEKIPRHN
ncbi:bacteriocin immunity protein [Liquorilactobacillus capillatus]|uniref:Bacteriocin immunity protein n=1 Tax=Liquorilactobacillus capillatus DSM 19910 TaxID=1423731 RepID=A0A0R1M314_9LACO|nr:bacteriocin immunity protein [Liquorilactobacillus capillatus]KRL02416.1 bacteriocin immunity protein [Liquorilactobacillus capillatus DSM 19910]